MALRQAKSMSVKRELERSASPMWRQPPARPRRKMRKQQSTTQQVKLGAIETHTRHHSQPLLTLPPDTGAVLRRVLGGLLALGLLAALAVLLQLPQFSVSAGSTQIGGVQRSSRDDVFSHSRVDGRNIFSVRAAEVEQAVTGLPGIAGATVHIRLPNQVIIDVTELTPLVAWQGITATVWLAADGAEVPQTGDLPPLRLTDRTGATLAESRGRWPHILSNLVALREMQPTTQEVALGNKEGLYLDSGAGWQAWLGTDGTIRSKLALLDATVQKLADQGIRPNVIDLRFSDNEAFWW